MIDWAKVRELRDDVGAEDFDEVVELFLEEVQETIDKLTACVDPASLEEDLHFLKGSALNLGFSDFSQLCQTGEKMSAEGQATDVDVAAILATYAASKTAFLAEMGQQLAA